MGVPNKRLKKLLMTTGIALGVTAVFKYLLPLVLPFFIALGMAAALRPWALWLQEKLSITVKGRCFCLPLGLLGGILLLGGTLSLVLLGYIGGGKLLREGKQLVKELPGLAQEAEILLTHWCGRLEAAFHLEGGHGARFVRQLLKDVASQAASAMMPYVMGNSMVWVKATLKVLVFLVVLFFGTVLALQEEKEIRDYFRRSVFHQEYVQMGRILKVVGAAYGKTQLLILAGTIAICMTGLFLLGNPYYGLLGVTIGLLDALPFIGTGTVFFPWAFVCFLQGSAGKGFSLLLIYLLAYLLRQLMESRVMGKKAGLSPFLTLAAVYVGIQLFGILGVALGPLGFLIVRESVEV